MRAHAGVTFVGRLIKSTGRTSIIVILLTALITVRPFLVSGYLVVHYMPGTGPTIFIAHVCCLRWTGRECPKAVRCGPCNS